MLSVSCGGNGEKTGRNLVDALSQLKWLEGHWQNATPEGTYSETWTTENGHLTGKSYFVNGTDTFSQEGLMLEQRGDEVYYVPTVKDQNNGKPVDFKLTGSQNNQWIFENPEHDFPQKISYTLVREDSLVAEISGLVKGEMRSEMFPMKRLR